MSIADSAVNKNELIPLLRCFFLLLFLLFFLFLFMFCVYGFVVGRFVEVFPSSQCSTKDVVCYPVCGMMHIKEPLLLIGKSSLCGGSGFPFSLSE